MSKILFTENDIGVILEFGDNKLRGRKK